MQGRTHLVARETEDDKALVLVLLVELLQSSVLRGEAATYHGARCQQI
jgi:hypothetical protein